MVPALVDPVTLVLNLTLFVCAVALAAALGIGILAAWTGTNIVLWRRQRRHAAAQTRAERYQPDGRPYPPVGRGLCDGCARAYDKVYYLPDGRRLCPACFDARREESP